MLQFTWLLPVLSKAGTTATRPGGVRSTELVNAGYAPQPAMSVPAELTYSHLLEILYCATWTGINRDR